MINVIVFPWVPTWAHMCMHACFLVTPSRRFFALRVVSICGHIRSRIVQDIYIADANFLAKLMASSTLSFESLNCLKRGNYNYTVPRRQVTYMHYGD